MAGTIDAAHRVHRSSCQWRRCDCWHSRMQHTAPHGWCTHKNDGVEDGYQQPAGQGMGTGSVAMISTMAQMWQYYVP